MTEAPVAYGRTLLPLWHLVPEATHLNHGSFGACPKEVLAAQSAAREEMERQPDQFFRNRITPGRDSAVRPVANRIGEFVGTEGDRLAMVENATSAVTAVLMSRSFDPGDEILFTNHTYNAVRLAIEHVARKTGAVPRKVEIPIPILSNDIVERFAAAAGPRTRLAVVDHITSPTAVTMPVTEIVSALKAKGVAVLVDGAHAVGQVPLNVPGVGADWYTSNAHKWLFAPKGTAFLYAAEDAAKELIPLAISHYNHFGFPQCFDYVGTRDVTGWLALPAAIAFFERGGGPALIERNLTLARRGGEIMAGLGAVPVAPDSMSQAMRSYILPQRQPAAPDDGPLFMATLWRRDKIQVASTVFQNRLLLRLSAQIYTEEADFAHLAAVLAKEGWPGR